jgi:hypothetical protein
MGGLTASLGVDNGEGRAGAVDVVRFGQCQGLVGQLDFGEGGGDQLIGLREGPARSRQLLCCRGLERFQCQRRLLQCGALDLEVRKEGVVEERDLSATPEAMSARMTPPLEKFVYSSL